MRKEPMDLEILLDTPPWDWPADAGKTFLKVLTDRRAAPSDRLTAATLAGDFTVINDDLAAALLALVRDAGEPENLRARAAISFGAALEQASIEEFDDPDEVPITERTFRNIQDSLRELYLDKSTPKELRRRILEASVRAPETWHRDAIGQAYSSADKEWMLTAVFSMRWVRGFDKQILAALNSTNPDIHYEAVRAAGNWELDAAWPHVVELVNNPRTPKRLLLAAIGAAGSIRPAEAPGILLDLADSDDEDIAEAADEAMTMAEGASAYEEDDDDEEENEDGEWVN
jgi:hypothetical protein